MLDRMDLLSDRVETFNSHQNATSSIISTARSEISAPTPTINKPAKQAVPASPVRRQSPVRMRSNTTGNSGNFRRNRRRSSGIQDEPAIEALLRNLALTLLPVEDATASEQALELAKA